MTKQIIFEDTERWSPEAGVDALANAIKTTLGRKGRIGLALAIVIFAVFMGLVSAPDRREAVVVKADLENVGAYTTASSVTGINYAVDSGRLFAGHPGEWRKINMPDGVIVGAIAIDASRPTDVYVGAANQLVVYHSSNRGQSWMRVPLNNTGVGGVTTLAMDSVNRVLYAGTDTAGVFRLRDVGSSMIAGGQVAFDTPIVQVVTDNTGAGLAFVRTTMDLYHAEDSGFT